LLLSLAACGLLASARAADLPPKPLFEGVGGCFPTGGELEVEQACLSQDVKQMCGSLCGGVPPGGSAVFGTLELAVPSFDDFTSRVRASADALRSLHGAAAGILQHRGGADAVILLGTAECHEQADGCVGVRFRIQAPVDEAMRLIEGYWGGGGEGGEAHRQRLSAAVQDALGADVSLRALAPQSLHVQVGPKPPASSVVRSVLVRHEGNGGVRGGDGAEDAQSAEMYSACTSRFENVGIVCQGATGAHVQLHSSESFAFGQGGWTRKLEAWGENVFTTSLCGLAGTELRPAEAGAVAVVEVGEAVGCRTFSFDVSVENTRATTFAASHQSLLQTVIGKVADVPAAEVLVSAVADNAGEAPKGADPLHWRNAGTTVTVRLVAAAPGQELHVRLAVGSKAVALPRTHQAPKCIRGKCGAQHCLSLKGKQRCAFVESEPGSCSDACR